MVVGRYSINAKCVMLRPGYSFLSLGHMPHPPEHWCPQAEAGPAGALTNPEGGENASDAVRGQLEGLYQE